MKGRIVTADDYLSNKQIQLILLTPTAPGEASLFVKMKQAGVKTLDIRFAELTREARLVIPDAVTAMPKKKVLPRVPKQ